MSNTPGQASGDQVLPSDVQTRSKTRTASVSADSTDRSQRPWNLSPPQPTAGKDEVLPSIPTQEVVKPEVGGEIATSAEREVPSQFLQGVPEGRVATAIGLAEITEVCRDQITRTGADELAKMDRLADALEILSTQMQTMKVEQNRGCGLAHQLANARNAAEAYPPATMANPVKLEIENENQALPPADEHDKGSGKKKRSSSSKSRRTKRRYDSSSSSSSSGSSSSSTLSSSDSDQSGRSNRSRSRRSRSKHSRSRSRRSSQKEEESPKDAAPDSNRYSNRVGGVFARRKGKKVPGLKPHRPADYDFEKLMTYRTYRLKREVAKHSDSSGTRLKRHTDQLRSFVKPLFDSEDLIMIFAFLAVVVQRCDLMDISEREVFQVLPSLLTGNALSLFRSTSRLTGSAVDG